MESLQREECLDEAVKRLGIKPEANARPLPNLLNGLKYPANRPRFFALKYLRMILKTCALIDIGTDGYALCSLVALTEDSKRYSEEPRFWTKSLMDHLGIKSRSTLCEIRDRCVKKGVLHYEQGRKGVACVMWVLWPTSWDKIKDGFLDADDSIDDQYSVQNLDRILTETQQNPVVTPSTSRTHSYLSLDPNSTTTKCEVAAEEFEEIQNRLLGLGLAKARETIQESLSNGTTLQTITTVIDYFCSRPGAWGPGALRRRLTLGNAQALASAQGWPPASSRETELRRSEAVVTDRLKQSADAQSLADRKIRERQLELQFGPILDALPREEIDRLVLLASDKKPGLLKTLQLHGVGNSMVRRSLLGLLAEAAEPSR
ncbi:MAG: hypothetical protein V4719_26500 [Planctomycetota bacterium]